MSKKQLGCQQHHSQSCTEDLHTKQKGNLCCGFHASKMRGCDVQGPSLKLHENLQAILLAWQKPQNHKGPQMAISCECALRDSLDSLASWGHQSTCQGPRSYSKLFFQSPAPDNMGTTTVRTGLVLI